MAHAEEKHRLAAIVMDWQAEFKKRYAHLIPEHMHEPLLDYVLYGTPVGGFLADVLRDEFNNAFARANDDNLAAMKGWAQVMYDFVPSTARRTGMAAWMKSGGLVGGAADG